MDRAILHADCNKFYASVECLYRPEIRHLPVAVGGNPELRHGIILTKNEIAQKYGISVGEPLWKARQKCPDLVIVPPNYDLYMQFSRSVRKIFEDYSDYIEPFGLDESWLDVTFCARDSERIAHEIRRRVKHELGITVSIGVSFNKVFAKLGSDYKKPDAITVINRDNFRHIVWNLPCSDLLYVGKSTGKKLSSYGINTIGDIALADTNFLRSLFGKHGDTLHSFANGLDVSPVRHMDARDAIKSVGNSTTTPRDLVNDNDVKQVFMALCESVARRMREQGFTGHTVTISVRDKNLQSFTRQMRLPAPTSVSREIFGCAMRLFKQNYKWKNPIRSLGVSVTDFDSEYMPQMDFDGDVQKREKLTRLENTVDSLRKRFGNDCIGRASLLDDTRLGCFEPYADNTIHSIYPV